MNERQDTEGLRNVRHDYGNLGLTGIRNVAIRVVDKLDRSLTQRYWLEAIAFFGVLTSLFLAFPSFDPDVESSRALAVKSMIHGLGEYWDGLGPHSSIHARVIAYRITVPLLARLLGLGLLGCYAIQYLAGVGLIYIVARLSYQATSDRVCTALSTLVICSTYAGSSAFVDLRPLFDGVAYFFLAAAMWTAWPPAITTLVVLASFTDERALVASGFVFLWWILRSSDQFRQREDIPTERRMLQLVVRPSAVVAAWIIYLGVRISIRDWYNIPLETKNYDFFKLINNAPMALWTAFEGGWIVIAWAIVVLMLRRKWWLLACHLCVGSVLIFGAISIVDMTRSMAYLFPAFIIAVFVVASDTERPALRYVLLCVAAVSVMCPAYYAGGKSTIWWQYPFPLQMIGLVMGL